MEKDESKSTGKRGNRQRERVGGTSAGWSERVSFVVSHSVYCTCWLDWEYFLWIKMVFWYSFGGMASWTFFHDSASLYLLLVVPLQLSRKCKTRHDLLFSLMVWSDADSCAIICMALNWNADFVIVKPIRNNWLVAFVFLKRWDWKVLCAYLPQPLIPASTMCVCIDMCARMSVGQSECQ